jgi:hypothetical protein
MILEKDTSVLGYPGETSKALNADHHNVCKYESRQDPNYIVVRNVLKSLVSKILTQAGTHQSSGRRQSGDLKSLLSINELPDSDFIFFRDQWTEKSGKWIFEDAAFLKWFAPAEDSEHCHILLIHGGPATGKSVLSSLIINELVERGSSCQYFYIRASSKKSRSLSTILRSLAYQMAAKIPSYLGAALDAAGDGVGLNTADGRTIWERLFKSLLPAIADLPKPLYWVIDGLDEALEPRSIIKQFADTSLSSLDLRILFVGRGTSGILGSFDRLSSSLHPSSIPIVGHREDMRLYIDQELHMAATPDYQAQIVEDLLNRSQNNFLVSPHTYCRCC